MSGPEAQTQPQVSSGIAATMNVHTGPPIPWARFRYTDRGKAGGSAPRPEVPIPRNRRVASTTSRSGVSR
jgi:hypothetical protein